MFVLYMDVFMMGLYVGYYLDEVVECGWFYGFFIGYVVCCYLWVVGDVVVGFLLFVDVGYDCKLLVLLCVMFGDGLVMLIVELVVVLYWWLCGIGEVLVWCCVGEVVLDYCDIIVCSNGNVFIVYWFYWWFGFELFGLVWVFNVMFDDGWCGVEWVDK